MEFGVELPDLKKPERRMLRFALAFTAWVGSPSSIIVHTMIFITVIVLLVKHIYPFDFLILVFNTAVSLEAIYLALFIQMTVNHQGENLEEVQEDIGELQEDVEEISEDVEEISEDVEEISEDVEEMTGEGESEEAAEEARKAEQKKTLTDIQGDLRRLMDDIAKLQKTPAQPPNPPPSGTTS
jgi:low affinity Fe/Cu permease